MAIMDIFKDQSNKKKALKTQADNPGYSNINRPKKVVVSVGTQNPNPHQTDNQSAREIIQDAREEAFRIKKAAQEESAKIRGESLELEKRIAQREESLDAKLTQLAQTEKQLERERLALSNKEQG